MTHVAFLRNVMIGRKGLERELLIRTFVACGASSAVSVLATGNVVFEGGEPADEIANRVSARLAEAIGLREPMFVRTLEHLATLERNRPFAAAPDRPAYERCVTFLPAEAPAVPDLPFRSKRDDFDVFAATGTEAFSVTRLVGGRPGQPGRWLEDRLGVPVTTRNWNTVERILRKYVR